MLDISEYSVDALGSEFFTTLMMTAHAAWLAEYPILAEPLYAALLPYRSGFAVDGIAGYFVGSIERTLGVLATQRGDRRTRPLALCSGTRSPQARALPITRRRHTPVTLGLPRRRDHDRRGQRTVRRNRARDPCRPAVRVSAPRGSSTSCVPPRRRRWLVAWNGPARTCRHSKGMTDLAQLLARPHTEQHVLDLIAAGPTLTLARPGRCDRRGAPPVRARLEEIEGELDEADEHGDIARSEQLHAERDALIAELSAPTGSEAERAGARRQQRTRGLAVTQRIRDAMARIDRPIPISAGTSAAASEPEPSARTTPRHP